MTNDNKNSSERVLEMVFVLKNTKIIEVTTSFAEDQLEYLKAEILKGFTNCNAQIIISNILNCVIKADHFYDNHNFGNGIFVIRGEDVSSFYIFAIDLDD